MVSMMKTRRLVPLADCLMRSHVCTEGHGQATWDIILQPGPDLGQCAGAPAPSAHGLAGLRCRACQARAAGKSLALFSPGKPRGRLDLTVLSLSLDYFPWGISPQSQTMVPDLPPEDLPIHRWSSPPHPPTPRKRLHRALGDTETRPATVLSRGSLQGPCPGLSTTHARVCIWPRSALQEHHTSLPHRLPQGPLTACSLGLDCGPQRHPGPRAWNLRLSAYVGMKFRMHGRQDCRSPLPGALVTPQGLSPQESPQRRFLQLSNSLIRGWGAFLTRLQIP